jgi:hypothetical protein
MKQVILLITAVVFGSIFAFPGENEVAREDYCKYITEQAKAERALLRSPTLIVGPTQPSAGTPPQMVFGLTGSLADNFKASLTMKAAFTACDLYAKATDAQQHIYYAAAKIEKDALIHRLDLVQRASVQLEQMISDEEKMVQAQNVTRPTLYYLQSARARLDMRRTSALTGIFPYVPTMSNVPVRVLVTEKRYAEAANQNANTKLARESGWDLTVAGGGRRQLGDFNAATTVSQLGAFGEVALTYNFGRHSANEHLNRSAASHLDLKANQFDDVALQAAVLNKQVEDTITFLGPQLEALLNHDSDIDTLLRTVDGVDTSGAHAFKNQLLADQIVLRVDIGDLQFRLNWLESFLHDNF